MGNERNFSKRFKISLSIVIGSIIVAIIAFYYFAGQLGLVSAGIIQDRTRTATQTDIVNKLAALKNDASSSIQYSQAMQMLLPTHDELINFPTWLSGLAHATGVGVSFSFSGSNTPATQSAPGTDGFSITATGNLDELSLFLSDLETKSQEYLLNVDSFNLVNQGGSNYNLSLQGELFSQLAPVNEATSTSSQSAASASAASASAGSAAASQPSSSAPASSAAPSAATSSAVSATEPAAQKVTVQNTAAQGTAGDSQATANTSATTTATTTTTTTP